MKKSKFLICSISLISAIFISGCGSHKSEEKKIDISRFDCSSSYKNLSSALSKDDGKGTNPVIFKDKNIFGYTGDIVFDLRDDDDTIKTFYAEYDKLSKKEIADIISQIEKTYGICDNETENKSRSIYIWDLNDSQKEKYGFTKIVLNNTKGNPITVSFMDDWSEETDEAYYDFLEPDVIAKKEYKIEDDVIDISYYTANGENIVSIIFNTPCKENAFYYYIFSKTLSEEDDSNPVKKQFPNFTFHVFCGDISISITNSASLFLYNGSLSTPEQIFEQSWINDSKDKLSVAYVKLNDFVFASLTEFLESVS